MNCIAILACTCRSRKWNFWCTCSKGNPVAFNSKIIWCFCFTLIVLVLCPDENLILAFIKWRKVYGVSTYGEILFIFLWMFLAWFKCPGIDHITCNGTVIIFNREFHLVVCADSKKVLSSFYLFCLADLLKVCRSDYRFIRKLVDSDRLVFCPSKNIVVIDVRCCFSNISYGVCCCNDNDHVFGTVVRIIVHYLLCIKGRYCRSWNACTRNAEAECLSKISGRLLYISKISFHIKSCHNIRKVCFLNISLDCYVAVYKRASLVAGIIWNYRSDACDVDDRIDCIDMNGIVYAWFLTTLVVYLESRLVEICLSVTWLTFCICITGLGEVAFRWWEWPAVGMDFSIFIRSFRCHCALRNSACDGTDMAVCFFVCNFDHNADVVYFSVSVFCSTTECKAIVGVILCLWCCLEGKVCRLCDFYGRKFSCTCSAETKEGVLAELKTVKVSTGRNDEIVFVQLDHWRHLEGNGKHRSWRCIGIWIVLYTPDIHIEAALCLFNHFIDENFACVFRIVLKFVTSWLNDFPCEFLHETVSCGFCLGIIAVSVFRRAVWRIFKKPQVDWFRFYCSIVETCGNRNRYVWCICDLIWVRCLVHAFFLGENWKTAYNVCRVCGRIEGECKAVVFFFKACGVNSLWLEGCLVQGTIGFSSVGDIHEWWSGKTKSSCAAQIALVNIVIKIDFCCGISFSFSGITRISVDLCGIAQGNSTAVVFCLWFAFKRLVTFPVTVKGNITAVVRRTVVVRLCKIKWSSACRRNIVLVEIFRWGDFFSSVFIVDIKGHEGNLVKICDGTIDAESSSVWRSWFTWGYSHARFLDDEKRSCIVDVESAGCDTTAFTRGVSGNYSDFIGSVCVLPAVGGFIGAGIESIELDDPRLSFDSGISGINGSPRIVVLYINMNFWHNTVIVAVTSKEKAFPDDGTWWRIGNGKRRSGNVDGFSQTDGTGQSWNQRNRYDGNQSNCFCTKSFENSSVHIELLQTCLYLISC